MHGIKRRASSFNTQRVDHIYQDPHIQNAHFKLHYGDLTDTSNLVRIVQETPQKETTPFYPCSPYAVAKRYAYWITVKHPRRHRRLLLHCEPFDGLRTGQGAAIHAPAVSTMVRHDLRSRDDVEIPIIRIDPRYFRPTEVETLLGDPSKAKEKFGWVPEIPLDLMVAEMFASDLAEAKQNALLRSHGYNVPVSVV